MNTHAYAPAYFVFRHGKCLKNVKGKTAGMELTLVSFGTDCAGCGENMRSSARIYSTVTVWLLWGFLSRIISILDW